MRKYNNYSAVALEQKNQSQPLRLTTNKPSSRHHPLRPGLAEGGRIHHSI